MLSAAAQAEENYTLKAKVISSESELKANSVEVAGTPVSGNRILSGEDDSVTAFGYGADMDFKLSEVLHAGVGVAFTDYMNDNQKTSYSDVTHRAYGAVELFTQPAYSLDFLAGVSYHYMNLKDTEMGPVTVHYEDLDLWNFDLGLNLVGTVAKNMTMGLGYQYTNTFVAEGVDANYAGLGLVEQPTRLKDIKLAKNEVIGSVGFTF